MSLLVQEDQYGSTKEYIYLELPFLDQHTCNPCVLVECTSVQNSGLRIRELQDEEDIALKQSWHVINDTLSFFFTTTDMLALSLPTNTSHHYLIPDSYFHLLFIHYLQCVEKKIHWCEQVLTFLTETVEHRLIRGYLLCVKELEHWRTNIHTRLKDMLLQLEPVINECLVRQVRLRTDKSHCQLSWNPLTSHILLWHFQILPCKG